MTIAELAEEADISPRTFFSYFATKESVVFADFDASFDGLAALLRARGPGESAIDVLEAWIVALLQDPETLSAREGQRRRVIEATEALMAFERTLMGRFEALLAVAIASDLEDDPADLHPRLIAAAATAALSALRPAVQAGPPKTEAEIYGPLESALVFLRGGIAALQHAADPATR